MFFRVVGDEKFECSALLGEDTEEEVSNLSPDSTPASPLEQYQVDDEGRSSEECKGDRNEASKRPCSLHLASEGGARARLRTDGSKNAQDSERDKSHSSTKRHLSSCKPLESFPTDSAAFSLQGLQGLVVREGEMVSFVAEDLQEQIKRASPIVKRGGESPIVFLMSYAVRIDVWNCFAETPSFPGSRSSTPSLYKQALTPQLAPIDPTVLNDIEAKACSISLSVNTILENLTGTLHSVSLCANEPPSKSTYV